MFYFILTPNVDHRNLFIFFAIHGSSKFDKFKFKKSKDYFVDRIEIKLIKFFIFLAFIYIYQGIRVFRDTINNYKMENIQFI